MNNLKRFYGRNRKEINRLAVALLPALMIGIVALILFIGIKTPKVLAGIFLIGAIALLVKSVQFIYETTKEFGKELKQKKYQNINKAGLCVTASWSVAFTAIAFGHILIHTIFSIDFASTDLTSDLMLVPLAIYGTLTFLFYLPYYMFKYLIQPVVEIFKRELKNEN